MESSFRSTHCSLSVRHWDFLSSTVCRSPETPRSRVTFPGKMSHNLGFSPTLIGSGALTRVNFLPPAERKPKKKLEVSSQLAG